MGALAVWSDTRPVQGHLPGYYQYAAVPLLFVLAAALRGARGRLARHDAWRSSTWA
jgi:hypothetical protein